MRTRGREEEEKKDTSAHRSVTETLEISTPPSLKSEDNNKSEPPGCLGVFSWPAKNLHV